MDTLREDYKNIGIKSLTVREKEKIAVIFLFSQVPYCKYLDIAALNLTLRQNRSLWRSDRSLISSV